MRRLAALLAAGLGVTPAGAEEATAGAPLQVRARAEVELVAVQRELGRLRVDGALREPAGGQAITGRPVWVTLRGPGGRESQQALTGRDGSFATEFRAAPGRYDVALTFDGDPDYGAAPRLTRTIDARRAPVLLRLALPERIAVGGGPLPVVVEAHSGARPAALPVSLTVGGRPAGELRTDEEGRAQAALPVGAGAGTRLLVAARFEGDRQRESGEATASALVVAPTYLTLRADGDGAAPRGHPLRLQGTLADPSGPLPGQLVDLVAGADRLGSGLSDEKGRFAITLPTEPLAIGELEVVARFTPAVSFRDPARSGPLRLVVLPPAALPIGAALAPLAATALLFLGLRLAPRLRHRLLRRRPGTGRSSLPQTGLVRAPRPLTAALRRPSQRTFSGEVRDALSDRPVAATLHLAPRGTAPGQLFACADDGRFTVAQLDEGAHLLQVLAPAYLPEPVEVRLPHHGELDGVRILLRPVRGEILALYRQAVEPRLEPGQIDRWTPREVLSHLELRGVALAPLRALVELLEEGYWSPRLADHGELTAALRLTAALAAPDATGDSSRAGAHQPDATPRSPDARG